MSDLTPPERRKNPSAMTEDQLHLVACEVEHGVRKALRAWRRGAVIAFVFVVTGFGVGLHANASTGSNARKALEHSNQQSQSALVHTGRVVTVRDCNRDFQTITNLRSVLIRGQESIVLQHRKGLLVGAQYSRAKTFYEDALRDNPRPDCRDSAEVLTDNPDFTAPIPTPRFPGDAKDAKGLSTP